MRKQLAKNKLDGDKIGYRRILLAFFLSPLLGIILQTGLVIGFYPNFASLIIFDAKFQLLPTYFATAVYLPIMLLIIRSIKRVYVWLLPLSGSVFALLFYQAWLMSIDQKVAIKSYLSPLILGILIGGVTHAIFCWRLAANGKKRLPF